MKTILHLMTQDDQPYGSARRCCERCGVMIWPEPRPAYTDEHDVYAHPPEGYVRCSDVAPRDLCYRKEQMVPSEPQPAA